MRLDIEPGRYVVAVSGGVDSTVLLDLLANNQNLDLVVAHYDHGIRFDSNEDRKLVEKLSKDYGLEFYYEEGSLGIEASEALARAKRYEFLESINKKTNAKGLITAHHQDDLIETAIINLLRGTNRKGLSSMYSEIITRPLLDYPKSELIEYAKKNKLVWREDSTNSDPKYLRNYVRSEIIPKLSLSQRANLLVIIKDSKDSNKSIDQILDSLLQANLDNNHISRIWFNSLPHNIAKEVMTNWLRKQAITVDKSAIEKLVVGGKTLIPGKTIDIDKSHILAVKDKHLALVSVER